MKHILTLLLVFVFTHTYCQNKITIGTTDTIQSSILKEKREILIYVPSSGNNRTKIKTRYPVIYLLDGYSFFHSLTGMVQYLSSIGKMPEMIVVAISSKDRVSDLTPTHAVLWSDGEEDKPYFKHSGGGELFTSFIEKELIPHIDSTYQTEPYRMFIGHSLGGLLVMNTLINHPALFNSYVAIDPSIWWDKQLLIKKKADSVFQRKDYAGKRLFFASANTMSKGMDTVRVVNDTANANVHVRDNLKFREILMKNKSNGLVWNWKYYEDDNHPTIPLAAEYDALRLFFKTYELPKELNDPSINAEFIKDHYQNVSKLLGYPVLPPQSTINLLGYNYLGNKNYDKSYQFFKMNIDNYPQSFNVYDSMGDYYIAIGDKAKAKTAFTKALSFQEHPDTRKKLQDLTSKK